MKGWQKTALFGLGSLALLTGAASGCGKSERPPLILTMKQREIVDTLYMDLVEGLAAEMDSLCQVRMATELDAAVDSILEVRRREEAALRKKYQTK